jgi:hypothetical protein
MTSAVIDKSKILVAQFYTENITYGKYSQEINKKYCDDNGYTYVVETNTQKIVNSLDGRSPTWYKPKFLLEIFETYNPEYVLFLDIDAVIVDHTEKIESFIDEPYDLVATRDYGHHSVMNAGVLLIKNTEWSRKLLNLWWYSAHFYTPRMIPELVVLDEHLDLNEYFTVGLWHDQTCLTLLYRNLPWINPKTKIINYDKLNWMHPFENNFIYHGFGYGYEPYRRIDEVHRKIFNTGSKSDSATKKNHRKKKINTR